jgi:ferritin
MLSDSMQSAMNDQINAELYSAYAYLSMAAYFEAQNLPGFAAWMRAQAGEELEHAMRFYDYIHQRRGRVLLAAIDAVPTEWESPSAVFEAALAHEQKVTGLIHDLVNLALDERDHASSSFLQWFVDEQVEEEASADAIVQKLRLMAGAPSALYLLDRELGQRRAGG